MGIKKLNLYLITILFIFIYNPPVIRIMMIHLLASFTVILLLSDKYYNKIPEFYLSSGLLFVSVGTMLAIGYLIIQGLFLGSINVVACYIYVILGIEFPICITYICLYLKSRDYTLKDFIDILLVTGTIQAVICLVAFMNNSIQSALIDHMVKYGVPEVFNNFVGIRVFGFARCLTSTAAVAQAVLASFAFYFGINYHFKYFLCFPLLAFSGAVNARVSIVILILGVFFSIIKSNFKKTNTLFKLGAILITGVAIIIIAVPLINNYSPKTYKWILNGIQVISTFILKGEKTGTFLVLFSQSFLALPDGIAMLVGKGTNIFGYNAFNLSEGSDIGYINDIWLGGIVLLTVLYVCIICFYCTCSRKISGLGSFISLFFISSYLVYNIKDIATVNSEFTALTILIVAFVNVNASPKEKTTCITERQNMRYFYHLPCSSRSFMPREKGALSKYLRVDSSKSKCVYFADMAIPTQKNQYGGLYLD